VCQIQSNYHQGIDTVIFTSLSDAVKFIRVSDAGIFTVSSFVGCASTAALTFSFPIPSALAPTLFFFRALAEEGDELSPDQHDLEIRTLAEAQAAVRT